jgi:hypothetical protein
LQGSEVELEVTIRGKKATVRPLGENESQDGVSKLRIAVHPGISEVLDTEFYTNFYRWYREKHPLGDQLYRWVAETPEGEVVGHLAGFPQYYRINGQRIIAYTSGDYEALPGYGFQAVMMMRAFFSAVENSVACDMLQSVIDVQNQMGTEVAGELRYAAKLLDVSRLPMPALPARLRSVLGAPGQSALPREGAEGEGSDGEGGLVEPPQRPRAPIPAPLKSALNGTLQAIDRALAQSYATGVKVEEIERFDDSFDDFFEKVAAVVPCAVEKDSRFLNWRHGPGSPQGPVKILCVRGGQGLLGYAILKVASSSREDGYVLDLTALPGYRNVARALLRESVNYFRQQGMSIIRYRFVESPTSPQAEDLLRLAFNYRKGRSNKLLVKFADPELHETARHLDNWSYSLGDGEPTFWFR